MHLSRSPYYQGDNFNSKTLKGIALKEKYSALRPYAKVKIAICAY